MHRRQKRSIKPLALAYLKRRTEPTSAIRLEGAAPGAIALPKLE
ncbi:hypothetical protein [Pleurocapsa sp. PCC 7327]|nr:hypothetical protein [Pleurocapsa sp. PCC 7327]